MLLLLIIIEYRKYYLVLLLLIIKFKPTDRKHFLCLEKVLKRTIHLLCQRLSAHKGYTQKDPKLEESLTQTSHFITFNRPNCLNLHNLLEVEVEIDETLWCRRSCNATNMNFVWLCYVLPFFINVINLRYITNTIIISSFHKKFHGISEGWAKI